MFSSGGRPLREVPIRELEIGHPLMRTPQSQRRNGCVLTFRDRASLRGSLGQAICSLAQIAAFPLPPHIHLSLLWQFISCVPIACGIHKQELSQKPRQDRKEGSDLGHAHGLFFIVSRIPCIVCWGSPPVPEVQADGCVQYASLYVL